jgi:hypothetical protein
VRRVVVTDSGVYHPKALVPRLVLYAIAMCAIAAAALAGRLTPQAAAMYVVLLALPAGWAFNVYRKFGALGRPCLLLANGELVMDRPQSSEVRFALQYLRSVNVHGMRGKRTYRFTGADGAVQEVSPLWHRKVEAAVIHFLQGRLPPGIEVTVSEPPGLFDPVRRDKA